MWFRRKMANKLNSGVGDPITEKYSRAYNPYY